MDIKPKVAFDPKVDSFLASWNHSKLSKKGIKRIVSKVQISHEEANRITEQVMIKYSRWIES